MSIALINCKPEVVSRDGAEITLRFPGGVDERLEFEKAVEQACMGSEQRYADYARRNGIDQYRIPATAE